MLCVPVQRGLQVAATISGLEENALTSHKELDQNGHSTQNEFLQSFELQKMSQEKKSFRGCLDPKRFIFCGAVNGPQEREYVVRIIISQGASNTRKEWEGARTIISINE
jgi:hypothetical protein